MKRFYSFLAAALCAFAMAPAPALVAEGGDELEIINCGAFNNYNTSHQYGPFAWLEYIVETRRDVNLCPYAVGVDAWVLSHPGGSASHTWDLFTASVRRPVLLPRYGVWQTTGAHWRILAGFWYNNGATASHANVREQQPDPAAQCAALGWDYYWNGSDCVFTPGSPIIVDTGRDGYELTSLDNGVRFDLNADGVPELVAWTRRNSDDEFLAMDRNGNGRIDSGAELFGNRSPAYADRSEVAAMNGFEALKFAQGPTYGRSTWTIGSTDATRSSAGCCCGGTRTTTASRKRTSCARWRAPG